METFTALISFGIIRSTGKGAHANTKLGCMIYSTFTFIIIGYVGSLFGIWIGCIIGASLAFILKEW